LALSRSALSRRWRADVDRNERAQRELLRIVEDLLKDMSTAYRIRPVPFVIGGLKEFDSFCDKAFEYERKGRVGNANEAFGEINDIVRARVICQTLEDARRLLHLLEDTQGNGFAVAHGGVQEHEGGGRTGYRGLHLELLVDATVVPDSFTTKCELQIQTALQYSWNLYTHKDIYKGENVPAIVADLMVELSGLLNVADKVAGRLLEEIEVGAAACTGPTADA